jgi:hypothetical protein
MGWIEKDEYKYVKEQSEMEGGKPLLYLRYRPFQGIFVSNYVDTNYID